LVGAKLDHRFAFQYSYYTAKNKGTKAPLCQFLKWTDHWNSLCASTIFA
jgi:hypothetical protein